MAMAKVIRPDSLRNMHHVLETSFLPEMYSLEGEYTSQRVSRRMNELGGKEAAMAFFYASLVGKNENALVYDITSLSSRSRNMEWLEYGYSRDGDGLPQVNLGLVVSLESRLPLLFRLFPGSVTDVVTLRNLVKEMRFLGVGECRFVLDRGFYGEGNIGLLKEAGIDFVMPLPFGRKTGKSLVSRTNSGIGNAENASMFKGEVYHVLERKSKIAGVDLQAIVLLNRKRESEEHQAFYRRLMDIEGAIDGRKVWHDPYRHFEDVAGRFARYLECTMQDGVLHLRRRQKTIAQAENRFGKMILLSSRNMSWEEALSLYRERDEAERQFDQLKNELELLPMRIRSMTSLRGLLFVFFVALVLLARLLRRAREAGLLARRSVGDILFEMGKIRAVAGGDRWMLTEVPKKARTVLEKLGIGVPVGIST